MDRDPKHLQEMVRRAEHHHGSAFLEIYQNCSVFNDGAFFQFTEKETRDDNVVYLEHGKPLLFGKNHSRGIRLNGFTPEAVDMTDGKWSASDLLVHDETRFDACLYPGKHDSQSRPAARHGGLRFPATSNVSMR